MAEVLARPTGSVADCGIKTSARPDVFIIRPIPEGVRAWLPALIVLLGMPLLALVTTKYGLIPTMKRAFAQSAAWSAQSIAGQTAGNFIYAKLPLNATGAPEAHTGFRSIAMIGADNAFKSKIEENRAKLIDLAASDLKDTTVSDLDKPGALEAKRAQLLADLNHALGGSVIQELYIAEWPPQ